MQQYVKPASPVMPNVRRFIRIFMKHKDLIVQN